MLKVNTNFIIFTQKRSGSTLLCRSLNEHQSIKCYNEPLNNNLYSRIEDTKEIPFTKHFNQKCEKIKWINIFLKTRELSGFKILFHQLNEKEKNVINNLKVKKIILFRENELARTLSDELGKKNKIL